MARVRATENTYLGPEGGGLKLEGEEFDYSGPTHHSLKYLDGKPEDDEQGTHLGVDLERLKKAELLAHALEHHGLELDPALTNPKLVAAIEEARSK